MIFKACENCTLTLPVLSCSFSGMVYRNFLSWTGFLGYLFISLCVSYRVLIWYIRYCATAQSGIPISTPISCSCTRVIKSSFIVFICYSFSLKIPSACTIFFCPFSMNSL